MDMRVSPKKLFDKWRRREGFQGLSTKNLQVVADAVDDEIAFDQAGDERRAAVGIPQVHARAGSHDRHGRPRDGANRCRGRGEGDGEGRGGRCRGC